MLDVDTFRSRIYSSLAALVVAALLVVSGCASEDQQGQQAEAPPLPEDELTLEAPWARPAPAGGTSAVYFRLANGTAAVDTLVEVRTPAADSVSIHETIQNADTTRMQPAGTVAVPAQQRIRLEPGGLHIMLMRLNQPLSLGDNVLIDVEFAEAGVRRISVPVRETAPGAQPQE